MAKHANEYLTPNTRASQGRIADHLWPVLDRRAECSTAHRGMPRTALSRRVGIRFQASGIRAVSAIRGPGSTADDHSVGHTKSGAPRRDAAHTSLLPEA